MLKFVVVCVDSQEFFDLIICITPYNPFYSQASIFSSLQRSSEKQIHFYHNTKKALA
ncbi:hypothetical protein VCRA2126O85_70141 [Vibrio crassostreae]|nr:hypothetical protein VCRA2128O100_140051 [Vibrio crassostreae]CAK2630437.1 hypothetical protein VCRA2126O84_140051 [Vibrio crassostreae]CAK2643774.1 hypothetical protein VCRA2127O91_150047 [Vibrio crassostreae]CAK2654741.1 hypothetical protein VCRA2126O86_160050 [Vibrio crassostreae]CAK3081649.1 hypothetical protein VCRA2125O83_70052 [Vibrio crassostreae]